MLHPLLTIFQKIHQANTDRSTATDLILRHYFQAQTTVVSFVYFLPLSSLFHKSYTQHDTNYIQALEKSDFILPDGIGLQFFWYWCMRSWIPNCTRFLANLNGTDFVPYLMNCVIEKYNKSHTCQLICYGSKKSVVHKVADLFQSQGREILSAQDGYQEFNRNALKNTSTNEKNLIRILLVARGTPLQEIRSMHHAQQIKNYKLLVIHVGGLFDFLAGEEKRAPRFMRMLKAERIRRFFSSPSKNGKKVLNSFSVFWFVFKKLILNRPLF